MQVQFYAAMQCYAACKYNVMLQCNFMLQYNVMLQCNVMLHCNIMLCHKCNVMLHVQFHSFSNGEQSVIFFNMGLISVMMKVNANLRKVVE